MTFVQPLWLFGLLLVAAYALWQVLRGVSRVRTVLHTIALAAAVVALAQPQMTVDETKQSVAVLVDVSGSNAKHVQQASKLALEIARSAGRHEVRLIPFARTAKLASREMYESEANWKAPGGDEGSVSDLEGAVRYAMATLPPDKVPGIVLVSDGQETSGSVARAAWQARELGIPLHTVALPGLADSQLRVDRVTVPAVAYAGERFPVELLVHSGVAAPATVELRGEGKPLGRSEVALQAGENRITLQVSIAAAGAIELTGSVESAAAGSARFAHAVSLTKAKILMVSQDPKDAEQYLNGVLLDNQVEVVVQPALPNDVSSYHAVLLNNLDLEAMPVEEKDRLERYTTDGGGLLVLAGERNLYKEGKKVEDALDRVLPAKLAPPKSPEGTLVVLIMDKSSSMEGRKMDLARSAAIGVIENLRPQDFVGVLIFDNSHQWAVPIRKAEDRTMIKRLVAGVTPDGGTQIAPALSEGYRKAVPSKGLYKHVVLLTDGISEEGDSFQVAKDASERRITISTVGLGQDVNRAYLERIATLAKGKSYFLVDPSGLEQILLKDVKEHTGGTAVERDLKPILSVKDAPVLDGVGMDDAPPLKGYVRFEPKSTAEVVMKIDEKDPLYSHWQFGLGRAAVFASDAKSRWAQEWIRWKGFGRFWANVVQDVLPRTAAVEATSTLDAATGEMVVNYRMRASEDPGKAPALFAFGPAGFQKPVNVQRIAPGSYRASVPLGGRTGMFRVRPLGEVRQFPEVGYHGGEPEYRLAGSNTGLLKQLAAFTGGLFDPKPGDVFRSGRRGATKTLDLWPFALALAVVANVLELVIRKLGGADWRFWSLRPRPA